ncbi:Phragmoplast orienting kinesin-1 [Nymphaea thermarum]|nr:Phragmoplast orienting kinesin-1 [Nymphaea thermarum]
MSEFRITGRNVRPQRSENESENVVDLPPFPPMRTPFSDYNQNPRSGLDHESTKLGKIGVSETGSNLVESLPLANRGSGLNLTPRSCRGKLQFEPNSGPNTPTRCTGRLSTGCFAGGGRNNPQSGSKGGILLKTTRGISSCAPASPGVEVPHFALEEDGSFWTDHNVQKRYPIDKGGSKLLQFKGMGCSLQPIKQDLQGNAMIPAAINQGCIKRGTDMLFKVAGLPMVENCMSGYNSCMFAYGQTGSGKTYTMMGELYDANDELSEDRGMTSRIFEYLFARTKLLREDLKKGVYVENLRELEVETVKDVLDLLFQGTANRKVAATSMNSESSRSHSVFTCVIESRWEKDGMTHFRFARLNLVDLAGSERQKSSGADGERLREAANINKSLSTLGLVIMTLVDVAHGKHRHVPYRDSRLTFLLQDSLGGNSKTTIIANVSPSISCAHETLSTLKFAQRAKLIQNNAKVNEDASGDVVALQRQIQELKLLDVFDKRDGQARDMPNDRKDMDHSIASQEKESLRLKVLNAVEELEDIKKSISATFKANTRLAREVDEMFVQVKESLNSTEPATEAMEKTSQPTSICKENMSHENDQDCKVMASSLELEELLNAKEEAWSLLETLEAQQVHLVNELADLREENGRNLGTSSVTECKDTCSLLQPMTFPQQVEVCSETFEPISENDTVSSESKQNLISPVNIENMNMIFEDIEKQSHQSSLASQPSDLHDMGDVCKRLQEADQMVLNLQAQITVLQHEIDKKSDSESISRKKLMLLRTENEELQNKLSLIIQENIRLTKVLEDKEEKFTALAESEKEADSLINSLMDGCHALEDASGQVSSIIDLFPERRIGEDEQVTGAIMAAHEKEKVISDLQTRLESAQKIGYRTNTELSCLKEAIMAITNAQMLENVEKCKEAMNLRMSLHDQTCLVHILEDKIKHQQGKLVEANRRANASFVFAGWLLSMNALQQKNKEGAHMHKPMTDTLHESISKWNQNSELSEAVLYIQSMQRHTENLEKEVEELKLALSPNNIRMGEGQEPKAYAEEKEKHKLQSRSESQKYCIPEDLISFSHQDIEKSRFLEAEDFLLNSKQRMGGKDVFCHQNSELPVLEPGHAASFAAERSNEAQSLLMKFGEAQETMKEADDVLNALLDAYEAAKHETVRWKKLGEDLMVEKAALIQQVQELKDSIQLKEQEYANIEDHFQAFMSEANDSFSLFENFFIHIKKSSSEFSLIHSDVSTFIQELLVSIRMLNSSTESVSLMILENKFALSTINHCLLDFTLQNTSLNTADSGCFYLRHSEVNGLADSFGETSMPTVKDNRKIEVINDTGKGVKRGCSESRLHVLECMGGMDMAEHVQNSSNGEDTDVDIILSSKRLSLDTVEHENGMAALLKDVRLMQDIINHLFIYLDRIGPCVDLLENVSANEKLANDDVMEKLLKTNSVSAEFACYNTRNDVKEFHEVDRSSSRANDRSVECHAGLTLEEAPFLADFQSLKNQCADLLVMLCGRSEDRHTCPWWRSSTAKQGQENDGLSTKRVSAFSNSPISSELCVPLVRGLINLGDKLNHLADSINPAKPNGPNLDVTSHKVEKLFQDICNIERKMNTYHAKISDLDQQKTCLLPENLLLSKGLNHRDLVMEGLLFDLRLLQESKSDAKDRKDEAEEMSKTLRKTRNDLAIKAANIDGILARQQKIEEYLTDKETAVAYLQSELADKQEALELISRENAELRILLDDLYVKKHVFEEQLVEQQEVIESLKKEIVHISSTVEQKIVSSLKNAEDELHKVITERDSLHAELATISGQLETALSLADENEAMAIEAQQVSEASKIHAEQKEEEARVLEQSVEELEHTINMLETKVYDMSKEVELQKLIREELELEMQDLKLRVLKTQNDPGSFDCKSSAYHEEGKDNIISRYLEERRNELMEAKRYIRMLQNEKEDQAEQIAKYQAYISELVLHSEAQASQFQEKYKALEAMACDAQHRAPMAASAAKRTEKTPVRTRASGSPFKCITGLVNQMHSDREHELHVARRRMEELESLAANRQKEVCSLNARLAVAESMTHDVIRDLLGVRLDLSTYAEEEILMLRRQLDDFMEERERLIEENNQKKSEVLDSQVKLEQLKHRQQLLTAQNELLQENRQPRACNDELDKRLKNSEKILSHVKDELAHYRLGRGGKAPAFGVELLKRT